MKKPLCIALALILAVSLCIPVSAAEEETEAAFVPEEYTTEELLAMDQELDSDGDGLVDVIELVYKMNRFDMDTDGDGVTDYTEFCITCTDPQVPDGEIDTDGDGLTNAQEAVYGTNPDDLDTDNDTFGDYAEIIELGTDPLVKNNIADDTTALLPTSPILTNPEHSDNPLAIDPEISIEGPVIGSGASYSATLFTSYDEGATYNTSSVSFTLNLNWFFDDNTEYNSQLATTSSVLSALAYEYNRLSAINGGTMATTSANAVFDWMDAYGFSHPDNSYDLNDSEEDQHVSEMFVGHRQATYGNTTKNIICIVIRGTNGTLDEWQSNFDVGGNSTSHNEWSVKINHMGFDVTVNRLNVKLKEYMDANGLNSSNSILWFTGHSRGGALANILAAKRVNSGYTVFGYTFASPGTTTSTNTKATKYCCIFNIINKDDFVPMLPMENWKFARYGKDVAESINDLYVDDWDALTGKNYTFSSTAQANVLRQLRTLSTTRDACYTYSSPGESIFSTETYLTKKLAEGAAEQFVKQYPDITSAHYRYTVYGSTPSYIYQVDYQPAFFLKMLAYAMSDNGMPTFLVVDMPVGFDSARLAIEAYYLTGSINKAHYLESYYLLATKQS